MVRLKEMYVSNRSLLRVDGAPSGWLKQRSGMRQESSLSPLVCFVGMERVVRGLWSGEDEFYDIGR